jgi:hypothetical protein
MYQKVRIKKAPKARTGYQVQGSLANDVPAMGGADYNGYIGQPSPKVSKYITAVPRDEANLEAEGGETVYGDINGDGMPEHKIIKGPRHAQGGVPLKLPDDTFIFSDFRGMKLKDPNIIALFGKPAGKGYTPATLAKQYDIEKYRKILQDPESDVIDKKTAELMIKNYTIKLGALALAQEAKKGFPQGIPAVARPYMEAHGLSDEDILPTEVTNTIEQLDQAAQQEENPDGSMGAEETMESAGQGDVPLEEDYESAESFNQGQPVARPQQQQQPSPDMMQQAPMAQYGRTMGGYDMPFSPEQMQGMQERMDWWNGQRPLYEDENIVPYQGSRAAIPSFFPAEMLNKYGEPKRGVRVTDLDMSQGTGAISGEEQMGYGMDDPHYGSSRNFRDTLRDFTHPREYNKRKEYGMYNDVDWINYSDQYNPNLRQAGGEAEYGMSMGANSQNYQGRTRRIPASGPVYTRGSYQTGGNVEVDVTGMTEEEKQRALYNARSKKENQGKQIIIVNNGKKSKEVKKELTKEDYEKQTEGMDLTKWGTGPNSVAIAAQYRLLEKQLENPTVAKKLCDETINSLNDPRSYVSSRGNQGDTWAERGNAMPDCDQIKTQFLNHQRRNLTFQANNIDAKLFSDTGRGLDTPQKLLQRGATNPETGKPITTIAEANSAIAFMTNKYGADVTVKKISNQLGVPLDISQTDRALQQATFHGYAHMVENMDTYSDDEKYALNNFVAKSLQSGVDDESGMTGLFKTKGVQISPIDDFTTDDASIYGNTTLGHSAGASMTDYNYEDLVEEKEKEKAEPGKKCPCKTSSGIIDVGTDANGDCNPCEEDVSYDVSKPAEWWLQDTIKTTGAFGDMMGMKKYMPWAPRVDLETPRPTFLDPTRELAAQSEQANIMTQGLSQFAGPQALSARASQVQGTAAEQAANTLSRYNNANVNLANQFEFKANDVRNQEQMLNQAASSKLYDQNTIANQQYDNSKLAMRNQLRNYYTNAITNRAKTDALNQMYPQYAVDPSNGGFMRFENPRDAKPETSGASYDDLIAKYMAPPYNMTGPEAAKAAEGSGRYNTRGDSGSSSGLDAIQAQYEGKGQKGGFVYADSMFPFIL